MDTSLIGRRIRYLGALEPHISPVGVVQDVGEDGYVLVLHFEGARHKTVVVLAGREDFALIKEDSDVTDDVDFDLDDKGRLVIKRCVCGYSEEYAAGGSRSTARPCPVCGRRLYYNLKVVIHEIQE